MEQIKEILILLQNNWMLVDEDDLHDYFILVDSNRKTNDLKPKKIVIKKMITEKLINTTDKFTQREFMYLLGKKHPIPFVYSFNITEKGLLLLNNKIK